MKIKMPKYYENFKCIASDCKDTCCKGWEIIIDKDTYKKYKNEKSEFGRKLNSKITFYEDNEPGFKLEGDRCPFLNTENLCDIYINLGKENLCYTCTMFPRIVEEYGSLREISLSLGCMEAAKLLLSEKNKIEFKISQNDELVKTYNEISFELYVQIINARNLAIKIIQNRDINFNYRVVLFLSYAEEIQKCIDNMNISQIEEVRKKYKDKQYIDKIIENYKKIQIDNEKSGKLMLYYIEIFDQLETINNKWTESISKVKHVFQNNKYIETYCDFRAYYIKREYEFENIMVYFIFRYFMKSLNDCNVIDKAKFAVYSLLIIMALDITKWLNEGKILSFENQIDLVHLYSKEVEHSDNNMKKLYNILETDKMLGIRKLISLIK